MEQPSKERRRPWIYARSPCCPKIRPGDVARYISHRKTYPRHVYDDVFIEPKTEIDKKIRELDEQAALKGDLVGKWLIFVERPKVDEAWEKISQAVIGGTLGIAAKVSTLAQGRHTHVICVYTYNYLDRSDVRRVRDRLKELGFVDRLYYKPDFYTRSGIYHGTKRLPASRYYG